MENFENRVNKLYDQAKDKISHDYHVVKEKMESTTEQIKDKASDWYEEGEHKFHNLEQNIGKYSDELVKKVREYPLSSLVIAAGLGYLLSKIITSKKPKGSKMKKKRSGEHHEKHKN